MKVIFEGNGEEVTGVKMESQEQQDEHNGGDREGDITKFVIRSENIDSFTDSLVKFLDSI